MTKLILAAALIVMAAVVVVLARGMGTLGKTGEENARYSNRMMQWRIGLQFVAVLLLVLLILITRG